MAGDYYDCTFFFGSQNNEGWSETYCGQATDAETMATAFADLEDLRIPILAPHFSIVGSRISRIDIHGDSYPVAGGPYPRIGTWSAGADQALEANTALKLRLIGTPPARNMKFLRGLSLDIVQGRSYLAPPAFVTAVEAYIGGLTSGGVWNIVSVSSLGIVTRELILDGGIIGPTARKPGRPFGSPVGRKFAHRTPLALASAGKELTTSAVATRQKRGSPPAQTP